jgi:lipopolysaccharide transport system permease protein
VFIKDMSQIVPPFVQMLMFLSPVLYPASAVPAILQPIYAVNPLGAVIELCRNLALGHAADWTQWTTALLFGLAAAWLGQIFFRHSREEFADAL